jgi:hypothetical protein
LFPFGNTWKPVLCAIFCAYFHSRSNQSIAGNFHQIQLPPNSCLLFQFQVPTPTNSSAAAAHQIAGPYNQGQGPIGPVHQGEVAPGLHFVEIRSPGTWRKQGGVVG